MQRYITFSKQKDRGPKPPENGTASYFFEFLELIFKAVNFIVFSGMRVVSFSRYNNDNYWTRHHSSQTAGPMNMVRYGTVRYGTVRYGTVRYGMTALFQVCLKKWINFWSTSLNFVALWLWAVCWIRNRFNADPDQYILLNPDSDFWILNRNRRFVCGFGSGSSNVTTNRLKNLFFFPRNYYYKYPVPRMTKRTLLPD